MHLLIALALCVSSLGAYAADAAERPPAAPWRVVILNSADVLIPFWLTLDPVMREAISARAAPRSVDFVGEALDFLRFPNLEAEQAALLKKKYAELPVDLIIAAAQPALEFATKYRDAVWHGAPIVFLVVPPGAVSGGLLPSNITGVYYDYDVGGTLLLMVRLQPELSRVVVAGGNSAFDVAWNARFPAASRSLPREIAIEYLNDRTPGELATDLARLPRSAAVFYTSMSRDRSGATQTPRDVAGVLARAASVPVYAMFPSMFGKGIVGGLMVAIEDEAFAAAELAVRVLRAGSARGIPVQPSPPPRCVLDFRALQRWDLQQRAVPDDCEIRFLPPSIWREYPGQVAAGVAAIAVLAALVVALLVQRRRRQQADVAVQHLRHTLFHASRLAAVGELTASIAHEINQPLAAILANADTAKMIIERDPTRIGEVRRILGDISNDDVRASAVIRRIRGLLSKRDSEPQLMDVNTVVGEVLELLRNEAVRRDIALTASYGAGLPRVLGDQVQLQQVVLNLVINAMDAMADSQPSRRNLAITTSLADNGSVEITIADQGHGIAPENFEHLFDSFWSTKAEGMGLGLAIVKSILDAHRGSIRAENNERGGATFRVSLPAAPAAAPAAAADSPTPSIA